jgi:hypothetical protein
MLKNMNNFNKLNLLIACLAFAGVTVALPFGNIFAQTAPAATQPAQTTPGVSVSTIISRADTEITQRVADLNDLIPRIESMKKISIVEQNYLTTTIQNEVNALNSLKAKVDADTIMSAARTDYQSITKSYRIYALVLPQTRIIAASDRVLTIVDSMNTVGAKVKSRIANITGTNAGTLNSELSDFYAKVSDASTQAKAASDEVTPLKPDQGNKTVIQSNTAALKDARSKIKTASDDLVAARKDIGDIVNYLKENASTATQPVAQ